MIGLGLRVKTSDVLLVACDACQARAGFVPTLVTSVAGWWAIPNGPRETVAALRANGEQQRRYGSAGNGWRLAAYAAVSMWLTSLTMLVAVGIVAVVAAREEAARPVGFVESVSAAADARRRARGIPLGLAEGSEPPASTVAATILEDVRRAWPDVRAGVRVDAARGRPQPGEIAGPLERIEVIVHVPEAQRFSEAQQRIVLRGAAAAARAGLGDADTRVRLFGHDGRGVGVMLLRGATEANDLPVTDVR